MSPYNTSHGDTMRTLLKFVTCIAMGFTFLPAAQADTNFPEKPIKIVVPSTPGGGFDVVSRILGQYLSEVLKQNIIIENRTGAGTLVGSQFAAKAPPDGYTLLAGGLSNIIWNMHLYSAPGSRWQVPSYCWTEREVALKVLCQTSHRHVQQSDRGTQVVSPCKVFQSI